MSNSDDKYIAIKVEGISHWLWFEKDKVTEESGRFVGKSGWGSNGAFTEIDVNISRIQGRITSAELQY